MSRGSGGRDGQSVSCGIHQRSPVVAARRRQREFHGPLKAIVHHQENAAMSTASISRRARQSRTARKQAAPKRRKAVPPYKNPSLSAEKRVKDLLKRMTLEEKAAQMICAWQEKATKLVDAQGNFD